MVGTIEARKLNLSLNSSNSKVITSIIYEPNCNSLALIHFDYSISLISQFSPFPSNPNSPLFPQTLIPPFNSSACFVPISQNPSFHDCPDDKNAVFINSGAHINPNPNFTNCENRPDCKDVVFITAGSHNGGKQIVLRFYVLGKGGKFGGVFVNCSQNEVCFDRKLGGVVVDVSHGMKVMLTGSVNYFVMYSASASKMMVFGLKLAEDGAVRRELRLVKCAVIECRLPVMSICVLFEFLMLGEMNGVRVFSLRGLVKGKVGNRRKARVARGKGENLNGEQKLEVGGKLEGRKLKMLNGVIKPVFEGHGFGKNEAYVNPSKLLANGYVHTAVGVKANTNAANNHHGTVKPRSLKLRQDSGECGMQFVTFNDTIDEGVCSREPQSISPKAISIQAVSRQKFLILNSNGDLYILHLSKSAPAQMRHIPSTIQVQQFAAFPYTPANSRVWISDGLYSAHAFMMPCSDIPDNEDGNNDEEEMHHCSVTQAIFTSEKIQDMIAVAANAVLLLGKDSLYAYAIS